MTGLRQGKRSLRYALAAAIVAGIVVPAITTQVRANDAPPTPPTPVLASSLVDNFNGPAGTAPNPQVWQHITGGGGWGNGELQTYTATTANAALDGHGHLVITARRIGSGSTAQYTSARLTTLSAIGPYIHAEARIRMTPGSGLWPTFWLLGGDTSGKGWPAAGEIDVAESVGQWSRLVFLTAHGFSADPNAKPIAFHWYTPSHVVMRSDVTKGFHLYAVDVTPDSIAWSIDHHVYKVLNRSSIKAPNVWSFRFPFHVVLDLAVGGYFAKAPTRTTRFPATMVIDYVRVTSSG